MPDLPYIRKGRYGTARLDHAACGRGYVVDFRAAEWVKLQFGDKSRLEAFQTFHAALAFFYALSGYQGPISSAAVRVRSGKGAGAKPAFGAAVAEADQKAGRRPVKGAPAPLAARP